MITIVSSIVTLCSLPQQFRVSTHNKRFLFFYLLTIVATVEFFLSGTNLMKQFCFFEIMTLASFAYVPNDESGYAKKASFSYLAYGIAGGLVMLYGLMLLYYTFSSWDLTSIRMAWQFNRNDPGVQRNVWLWCKSRNVSVSYLVAGYVYGGTACGNDSAFVAFVKNRNLWHYADYNYFV